MVIDSHKHVGADIMFWLRGDFPYAQHLVRMTRKGGPLGADRWSVFPFVINLSLEIEALRRDAHYRGTPAQEALSDSVCGIVRPNARSRGNRVKGKPGQARKTEKRV